MANETNHISETDKAYAAGIIDGEGSLWFDMTSGTKVGVPKVCVMMTKPDVVDWFKLVFDGYHRKYKNNYGPTYGWMLSGPSCQPFLEMIKPYIKLKRPQLDVMLAFCATIRPQGGMFMSRSLDDKTLLYRLQLADLMKGLNAKQKRPESSPELFVKEITE